MHTALTPTLHIFCEVGSHWHQWLWWRGGLFKPHQGWRPILRLTSDARFTSDSRSPFKFVNIEWTWTLLEKIKFLGQTEPRFKSCCQHFLCALGQVICFLWASFLQLEDDNKKNRITLQLYWLSFSLNKPTSFPPQGLCKCCAPYLEPSSPNLSCDMPPLKYQPSWRGLPWSLFLKELLFLYSHCHFFYSTNHNLCFCFLLITNFLKN